MSFKDLLEYSQAQAIVNTLEGDEESVWRSICRRYSKTFSTPLHECLSGDIAAEDILLAVFEDQLSNFDEEKDLELLLERVYKLEDPNYEVAKSKELDDFVAQAEEEEKERIAEGRPIPGTGGKNEPSLEGVVEKPIKSGSVDFSQIQDEGEPGGF